MSAPATPSLLDALLDSWDRNNRILVNLLRLVPEGGLGRSATAGGPTVAQLFAHAHSVRLAFVDEDAPEVGVEVPQEEWIDARDVEAMEALLDDSARAVAAAVRGRLASGRAMDRHYDHPILMLQHLIWHEGYHHGQIKLALKLAGTPITDRQASAGTWGVWMRKTTA